MEVAVRAVLADPATSEVVVVDDGSVDDTADTLDRLAAQDPRVRREQAGGEGSSKARQVGLAATTADLVLMIDDDVVAPPGMVSSHLARHCEADDADLVLVGYMPTRVPEPRRRGQFATRLYAAEYERHVKKWEDGRVDVLDRLWLGNVSANRATLMGVGMDDPAFPAANHEDWDLGLRLKAAGCRGRFDRSLLAEHCHQRRLDQFVRDSYWQGRGRLHLARLYGLSDAASSALGDDLHLPPRLLVRMMDRPVAGAVIGSGLRALVVVGGRLHFWVLEDAAARLLRRSALRQGARAAAAEVEGPSVVGTSVP